MTWKDCLENRDVLNTAPNKFKVDSLIETAKGRLEFTKKPKEGNANYVFEDYYTSVLELLHAKAILDGFKIRNHLCIGFYLKGFLKQEKIFNLFDDVRYKRNSLVYYGKKMDFETCLDAIEKCDRIIKWVLGVLG